MITSIPQQYGDTMAGVFLARMAPALEATAEQHLDIDRVPRSLDRPMIHEIDLACDALHDATAERSDVAMFGVPQMGQLSVFTLPDGSAVTALASWGDDHIDLLEGRYEYPDWLAEKSGAVVIRANNPTHLRAFENICQGSNAPNAWQELYESAGWL